MKNHVLHTPLEIDLSNVLEIEVLPSILRAICNLTGMGFAAVARITDEKWITCVSRDTLGIGLKTGSELDVNSTPYPTLQEHRYPILAKDFDKVGFTDTTTAYQFKSFVSFPIFKKDGSFFGTLCALDSQAKSFDTKNTIKSFELYCDIISKQLASIEEIDRLHKVIEQEKRVSEHRETSIAVLGHDLRNPLSTTRMCADILLGMELPEFARKQAENIKSTSYRMQGLINNMLDFAKGHLGDGIVLNLTDDLTRLKKSLHQVIEETKTIGSNHHIEIALDIKETVVCDINRICQLYSNLLGNAIKHGTTDRPVTTEVKSESGFFQLMVSNSGKKIPEEKVPNLFKPFFSTHCSNNTSGLGLGLYISSEIAKAHGGTMDVESNDDTTKFTFMMPVNSSAIKVS